MGKNKRSGKNEILVFTLHRGCIQQVKIMTEEIRIKQNIQSSKATTWRTKYIVNTFTKATIYKTLLTYDLQRVKL